MALLDFDGLESGQIDLSSKECENGTIFGTIVAGALKPGTSGAYHAKLNSTDVKTSVATFLGSSSGLAPVGNFYQYMIDLKLHQNGTQKDFALFSQHKGGAAGWEVRYEGATDGKLHFFVNNTEVDAGSSFTAPLDATFTLMVYLGTATKQNELWIDLLDGASFTRKHSDTTVQYATSGVGAPTVGTSPGAGNTSNLDIEFDNFVWQSDDTAASQTALVKGRYLDIVAETANGDGTNLGWTDHLGTACSVGGTNCYLEVNQLPSVTTSYITATSPAGVSTLTEDVTVTNVAKIDRLDLVYALKAGGKSVWVATAAAHANWRIGNSGGSGQSPNIVSGTNVNSGGYPQQTDPATTVGWTASGAVAAVVGASMVSVNEAGDVIKVDDVYKFLCFYRGPKGKIIEVTQAVNRAGTY